MSAESFERRFAHLRRSVDDLRRWLVDETLQIGRAWDSGDVAARQRVLEWWVQHVEIKVRPAPGRTRGTVLEKTMLVWLHTAPNDPRVEVLGAHVRAAPNAAKATSSRRSPPCGRTGSRRGAAP
jgi:hypothetical protein